MSKLKFLNVTHINHESDAFRALEFSIPDARHAKFPPFRYHLVVQLKSFTSRQLIALIKIKKFFFPYFFLRNIFVVSKKLFRSASASRMSMCVVENPPTAQLRIYLLASETNARLARDEMCEPRKTNITQNVVSARFQRELRLSGLIREMRPKTLVFSSEADRSIDRRSV